MNKIELKWQSQGRGAFVIEGDDKTLAEMVFSTDGHLLTVYHTEVDPSLEGKGVAKELLGRLVAYAEEQQYKILPLCAYVHAQFERHPEEYAGVWKKD
jgi:uncharacterized protein